MSVEVASDVARVLCAQVISKPRTRSFPEVDLHVSTHEDIVQAIHNSPGIIRVRNASPTNAPFNDLSALFAHVAERPDLAVRANTAYTKNLIFKDSFANGRGGPAVDQKRVLDLSPARLDEITAVDPALEAAFGAPLQTALHFFDGVRTAVVPRLLAALADAAKVPAVREDALCNYRMVDYYARTDEPSGLPPRCGAHRDFGSLTLLFQDGVSGLQVCLNGDWVDVPPGPADEAVVLFGWCTTMRSNGRVPAIMHRVADPKRERGENELARRMSAIFFVAPSAETSLAPVVLPGEKPLFRDTTAGDLRELIGRKWMYREGTISEEGRMIEEEERKLLPTQDSAVAHRFLLGSQMP